MPAIRKVLVIRDLGRLFRNGALPSEDGALLASFLADNDEAAFEAIVERHGLMVLGVCRRLLGDSHDADDAFQATFLVLVRKAWQLRDARSLGPWLYGVATRVATKARAREIKRRGRLKALSADIPARSDGERESVDFRSILDAELGKLSPKLRDILVLCLLEGLTAEEASQQLACPVGTAKSRLARGREALRGRLAARGLAPAAALAAAAGTSRSALASAVTRSLALSTVRIATMAPERIPHAVVALTKGMTTSMLRKSSILTALLCGGLVLAGAGVSAWQKNHAGPAEPQAQEGDPEKQSAARASINHMKTILLALHKYHSANGHFPPAAIYGADGEPKLSWRVAILPFLNEEALYKEFHLDEAWDSPHNKALLMRMPDVFTTPSSPTPRGLTPRGLTRIRGFEGHNTFFGDRGAGLSIAATKDGASDTLALVAASEFTPWTFPGELHSPTVYVPDLLDEGNGQGTLVAFVNGSAQFLPQISDSLWRMMITPAGGEVLDWSKIRNAQALGPQQKPGPVRRTPLRTTLPPPTARARTTVNPAPARAIAPELEARLRAIETKLDRLMRKLEDDEQARKPK